jgi:hypothetical protein
MGEQDGPRIADPVMKADGAFGGVGREIRGGIANLKSHHRLLAHHECVHPLQHGAALERTAFGRRRGSRMRAPCRTQRRLRHRGCDEHHPNLRPSGGPGAVRVRSARSHAARGSAPMRRFCRLPKKSTLRRKANGRVVNAISAGCLCCPDSAKIRCDARRRYPKIARKFHFSPSRL